MFRGIKKLITWITTLQLLFLNISYALADQEQIQAAAELYNQYRKNPASFEFTNLGIHPHFEKDFKAFLKTRNINELPEIKIERDAFILMPPTARPVVFNVTPGENKTLLFKINNQPVTFDISLSFESNYLLLIQAINNKPENKTTMLDFFIPHANAFDYSSITAMVISISTSLALVGGIMSGLASIQDKHRC